MSVWAFPVPASKGRKLRNTYACRRPGCASSGYAYQRGKHGGIDIDGDRGDRVNSVVAGVVVGASTNIWGVYYGRQVLVRYKTPGGSRRYVFYAHLNTITVRKGQRVTAGQKIGTVGSTGNVTGSHLHFEHHTEPSWTGGLLNPYKRLEAARTA